MNQNDLPFDDSATNRRIETARRGAENESPGWTEEAAAALRKFSGTVESFIIEEARSAVSAMVGDPSEPRAWGAATRIARLRGWIAPAGFRTDQWGSPKTVWCRGGEA